MELTKVPQLRSNVTARAAAVLTQSVHQFDDVTERKRDTLDEGSHDRDSENPDDDQVEALFHRMKCDVKPRKMRCYFWSYQDVFYGEECVSWILKNSKSRTVDEAIDLGNRMIIRRYIAHFMEDRPLENKKIFYRYTDQKQSSMDLIPGSVFLDSSWIADWKWKLLMHSIVSDCNKKYKEKKLIGIVARKLKRNYVIVQLLKNLRLMSVPFFRLLPTDIYQQITKLCTYKVFSEGKILVRAGDTTKRLSVILLGCASTEGPDIESPRVTDSAYSSCSSVPEHANTDFFSPSSCFCEETLRGNPSASTIVASTGGILFELVPEPTDLGQLLFESKNKVAAAQALIYLKMEDVGFEAIKNYPKAWTVLTAFMNEEFAAENIHFIDKVDDFKAMPPEDHQHRLKRACAIYHTFLTNDATQEVNVTSKQRLAVENLLIALLGGKTAADISYENVESATTNIQVPQNIFDECYKEVWKMIEKDNFPRFKESIKFKVLLFKLGALKDDPAHSAETHKRQLYRHSSK